MRAKRMKDLRRNAAALKLKQKAATKIQRWYRLWSAYQKQRQIDALEYMGIKEEPVSKVSSSVRVQNLIKQKIE